MTLHDTWRSLPSFTLNFRLGWTSWLALSLVLAFSAVCAVAWMNSEQIVAWLLSQGMVEEADTGTLPGVIKDGATGAGIAGFVAAHLIVMRGRFGIYPWTPLQALAGFLGKSLRPVFSPIRHVVYAALHNIGVLAAWLFRCVQMASSAIFRSIWLAGEATFVHAAKVLAIALGWVRSRLSASIGHSGGVLALVLRKGWAAMSIPLTYARLGVVAVLDRLLGMATATARYSQQSVSAVIRPVRLLFQIFVKVAKLALVWIIAVLGYQRRVASAIDRFVKSVAGHMGHGATTILEYVVRVLGRALGYAWVAVWIPFYWASRSLAFIHRNVQLGVVTLLSHLKTALLAGIRFGSGITLAAARLSWRTVSAVAHPVWSGATTGIKYMGRALGTALGYSRLAVWAPLSWTWRSLAFILRNVQLGVVTLLVHLGRALIAGLALAWTATVTIVRPMRNAVSAATGGAMLAMGLAGHGVAAVLGLLGVSMLTIGQPLGSLARFVVETMVFGAGCVGRGVAGLYGHLSRTLKLGLALAWMAAVTIVRPMRNAVSAATGGAMLAMGLAGHGVAAALELLGASVLAMAQSLGFIGRAAVMGTASGAGFAGKGLAIALVPIWLGIAGLAVYVRLAVTTLIGYLQWVASLVGQAAVLLLKLIAAGFLTLAYGAWQLLKVLLVPVTFVAQQLWIGTSTAALLVWFLAKGAGTVGLRGLWGVVRVPSFLARMMWTGISAAPNTGRAALWLATNRKEVFAMNNFNLTRQGVISLIATLWILGLAGTFVGWKFWPTAPEPVVEVWHWATGHLMREGDGINLLPVMAERFNEAEYRTKSGTLIRIRVHNVPSELIAEYLIPRVNTGTGIDLTAESDGYVKAGYGEPILVTPSSAHWLIKVNHEVGWELVDLDSAQSLVRPVIGIVTYAEMARCLGWPEKELGFADILELRADPLGWARYECARPEWGQRPLVAFTDPSTSSTGRRNPCLHPRPRKWLRSPRRAYLAGEGPSPAGGAHRRH